jgi:hypothetical protein
MSRKATKPSPEADDVSVVAQALAAAPRAALPAKQPDRFFHYAHYRPHAAYPRRHRHANFSPSGRSDVGRLQHALGVAAAFLLAVETNDGTVHCHARLGGTLNFYYRKAA